MSVESLELSDEGRGNIGRCGIPAQSYATMRGIYEAESVAPPVLRLEPYVHYTQPLCGWHPHHTDHPTHRDRSSPGKAISLTSTAHPHTAADANLDGLTA